MSDALLGHLITGITTIIVALIGAGVLKINGRVKRVQAQVENDHSSNLREELDARHNETRGWFNGVWAWMTRIDMRLQRGDERMDRIEAILDRHDREIDSIEDTLTTRKETQ